MGRSNRGRRRGGSWRPRAAAARRPLADGETCVLSAYMRGEVAAAYAAAQAGRRGAATAAALVGGPGVGPGLRAAVAAPLQRAIDAAFPRSAP